LSKVSKFIADYQVYLCWFTGFY